LQFEILTLAPVFPTVSAHIQIVIEQSRAQRDAALLFCLMSLNIIYVIGVAVAQGVSWI
jgi:hypothetical protein